MLEAISAVFLVIMLAVGAHGVTSNHSKEASAQAAPQQSAAVKPDTLNN